MKIGLVGWYGHDNYGDERIKYCIQRYFSNAEFFIVNGMEHIHENIIALNSCDYILLGGGGLITLNIGRYLNTIQQFKIPYSFIGIGVEAEDRSMRMFFDEIKRKAEFIYVRDNQSKRILGEHHKIIVGPDISFLYPLDVLEPIKADACGLNLRAWFYWKAVFDGKYHKIMQRLSRRFPAAKQFYPLPKWDPDNLVSNLKCQFQDVFPIPLYFQSNGTVANDVDVLSRYFKNVPGQFSISLFKQIRFLVAMRFHAIVFASQCGIPFISLSYQPKNERFCSGIGIKNLSLDIFKISDLESKITYLREQEIKIRECLLEYRAKSILQVQSIFQDISKFIK